MVEMLVHRNPEGVLPDFRCPVHRKNLLRLVPYIVQKIVRGVACMGVVVRKFEVPDLPGVVSAGFKGKFIFWPIAVPLLSYLITAVLNT